MPLSICDNIWLRRLVLRLCPRASWAMFVEKVLLAMVKKTMQLHLLLELAMATTLSVSFDLWMSRGGVDTFALVINYLNEFWMP